MSGDVTIKGGFSDIAESAVAAGIDLSEVELAALIEQKDLGEESLLALGVVFSYLATKRRENKVKTLLKLSRLPQKEPKTFENFDFARIQGKDAKALRSLPTLSNLYARKNIAFIGPGGVGKTHLSQAFGYACCMEGFKSYYIKASELKDKMGKAINTGSVSRLTAALVKPSCLIIDEVGRGVFDRACTDLFFDIIDRRYEKDVPNTLIVTSNTPVVNWDRFFTGTDTLECTLDRIFDKASVFIMQGTSFRGAECDTFTVEAAPKAIKLSK